MARKINLNSGEIYQKLGSPSISPRSTVDVFFSQDKRKSISQERTPHIQSPDFSKQLPRIELQQFSPNVHEKRFVAFQNFPSVSSRVPRIPVPDISRTTGRNFMSIYNKTQVQKDYSPNYQTIWKGSGKKLLKFDATLGRKPLYEPPEFNFNSNDISYKQVDANLTVPNMEKTSSRPDEKKVPSFMVGVHYLGRVPGHNMVNFKSLKMNNFMNTTFMPLKSSFGEKTYKSKSVMRPMCIMEFNPEEFYVLVKFNNIQDFSKKIQQETYALNKDQFDVCKVYLVFELIFGMDFSTIEANVILLEMIRTLFSKYPVHCRNIICIETFKKTLKFCSPVRNKQEVNLELLKYGQALNPSELFLLAAKHGRLCTMIYLKENSKVNLYIKDEDSNSVLHILASQGYVHSCVCFIHWIQSEKYSVKEKKNVVNLHNQQGYTPLHFAALSQSENMCKFLLYLGADKNERDHSGLNAYELGKSQGVALNILKLLKPSWRSSYRTKSNTKYILNLGFQLFRYFLIFSLLLPYINFIYTGISLTLSACVLVAIVYISNTDPGFASQCKEDLQELVIKHGQDTCTKCKTVQFKRNVIKHCWDCQRCVEKYDHHCPWLRTCIAKNNSNCFIWYLALFELEMIFHSIVCVLAYLGYLDNGPKIGFLMIGKFYWEKSVFLGLAGIMLPCQIAVFYVLWMQVKRLYKGKTFFEMKYMEGSPVHRPRSVYEDFRQNSVVSLRISRFKRVSEVYS